ncbi:MAG TPA: TolC family protein [Prolixibacteraceae bacterium]|nr:TolC family protein [Prolixibacteraceae bacterium]
MRRLKHSKTIRVCLSLVITLFIGLPLSLSAQGTLQTFLDSALVNNPEAVSIHTQIRSYQFDDQMISAILRSPKAFVSSEVLVSPYLNNNGKLIDIAPSGKAIGYDIGITNGGLYSLLFNLELPLLKGKQIIHLQEQNQLEVDRFKTRLRLIENELKRSVGSMYFDVYSRQATLENNRENLTLLNDEFMLIKSLTRKGLYRFSDYKLMELELKSDSINLNTSVNDLELAIRQLKATCGIRNNEISKLTSPLMIMMDPVVKPSLFIRSFANDSMATIAQQQVFNDRYQPQLRVYANSGLNSTSVPQMERHVGASAGVQLTYTLFDGHQKRINEQQQMLRIDEATSQKGLKINEVKTQTDAYRQSIKKTRDELQKEKQIQEEYKDLLLLYQDEVKSAQISVIDLIAFLKKYSSINLSVSMKEITLNKLINEYNYWNH